MSPATSGQILLLFHLDSLEARSQLQVWHRVRFGVSWTTLTKSEVMTSRPSNTQCHFTLTASTNNDFCSLYFVACHSENSC